MKNTIARWFMGLALLFVLVAPGVALAQQAFSDEQLDQMLAPVALYPDALLSQVLMASTYPADVAEAVKWSKANPNQQGDAAVKAVAAQPWDASVQSLVAFPQVLAQMGERPDWVQNLGDAFLDSPERVMDRVQFLRRKAQAAGSLKTTEQQKVIVEPAPAPSSTTVVVQEQPQQIIRIEPAQPQVVYVPAYNPTVVYGSWWWPSYPPVYLPPPPGYVFGTALASGIAFGVGIGITNALWGGCNWGRGDVNINVNRYNNINVNKRLDVNQNNVNWKHNADNRRGVPYKGDKVRQQYGNRPAGAGDRANYRGRDASRDAARDRASQTMQNRGVEMGKGVDRAQTRDRAQSVDRDRARDSAQNRPGGVDRDRAQAQQIDRDRARDAAQSRGPRD
ncbi:MAG: DUF3300 domain-containing protein, partial [Burkholderiales bacterium]